MLLHMYCTAHVQVPFIPFTTKSVYSTVYAPYSTLCKTPLLYNTVRSTVRAPNSTLHKSRSLYKYVRSIVRVL